MLGEREARGKSIHSVKKTLDLHEMDSLPLAAYRRSAENDKCLHLNARRSSKNRNGGRSRRFFVYGAVITLFGAQTLSANGPPRAG